MPSFAFRRAGRLRFGSSAVAVGAARVGQTRKPAAMIGNGTTLPA